LPSVSLAARRVNRHDGKSRPTAVPSTVISRRAIAPGSCICRADRTRVRCGRFARCETYTRTCSSKTTRPRWSRVT
jgi:hypothetical protein